MHTTREHGPWTRPVNTARGHDPWTRSVYTDSVYRALTPALRRQPDRYTEVHRHNDIFSLQPSKRLYFLPFLHGVHRFFPVIFSSCLFLSPVPWTRLVVYIRIYSQHIVHVYCNTQLGLLSLLLRLTTTAVTVVVAADGIRTKPSESTSCQYRERRRSRQTKWFGDDNKISYCACRISGQLSQCSTVCGHGCLIIFWNLDSWWGRLLLLLLLLLSFVMFNNLLSWGYIQCGSIAQMRAFEW